jgi:hypothetical protein
VQMEFMNMPEMFTMPDDTPYGLRVLMRNHLKAHDHVGVGVVGPK